MVFLDSTNQVFSNYHALMLHFSVGNSVFLRGFSATLHIVLLSCLLATWVCRRLLSGSPKIGQTRNKTLNSSKKTTLLCCLGESVFSLVMFSVNYFFKNGWSHDKLASLLDLAVRTIAWGAVSVYLHSRFSGSAPWKLPGSLSVWLVVYLFMSCYFLVLDTMRHVSLGVWSFESDIVSVLSGFFLCYMGLFGKLENFHRDDLLEEPLINGNSSQSSRGGETLTTPYSNATIFSLVTFSWLSPLVALGNKKVLDLKDVPLLDSRDSLVGTFPRFKSKLQSIHGDGVTTSRLVKALLLFSWKEIVGTGIFALLSTVASYIGPYLIDTLVQYLTGRRTFKSEGYFLVSAFVFAKLVECVCQRQRCFRLQQVEIRVQGILVGMIYDKGLTLSCHSRQVCTSGEIVNLMSVDAERVSGFAWHIHDSWLLLLQIGLSLGILYKNLGFASIAAFLATVLVMLANAPLSSLLEKYEAKMMESKDARMKATSETLRNMRILKLQAWEMKFLSKIQDLRKTETRWLKSLAYTDALTSFVFWGAPMFISVVTFCTCMIMGVPLETGKVLSALATFRTLQEPIYNLPDTISTLVQTKVSLDRIASFLCLDGLQTHLIETIQRGSNDTALEIINGTFSWSLPSPTLKDINLKVRCGMRVAVCGSVGSGKTSLLSSILGEMPRVSGAVKLCGSKAYVAQSSWIQSGKIVDNILFGKEMDKESYERVIDACCLRKDLEIMCFGDQTVIGERGVNLSGGQKQRIQMARALYQDADIYLFDDPFSAVDALTGSHLFKECLMGMLRSKTVIYVTHQVEFLPAADVILVMKDGRIVEAGNYNDILQSGTNFSELVTAHKTALSELGSVHAIETANEEIDKREHGIVVEDWTQQQPQGQLVQEEEREKGSVGFQVYLKYITTSYGGALVPLILLSHILFQALQIGSNYWMAWATPISAEADTKKVAATTLITIYVALAIVSSLCVLVRSLLLATAGYKTAIELFNKMHFCIFRAPMSFFDSTPSGRILNRASSDQTEVDTDIHHIIAWTAFLTIQLLGAVVVMSQVAWQVFIIFIPVSIACVWYQRYYISTARELSRLIGVTRTPLIQHFAETISGSITIRCFDQEPRFRDMNVIFSDGYSRPEFHNSGAMEWLGFRLDMLSCVMFGLCLVFLVIVPAGFIDPAIAGLAVTYGLNLNTLQAWLIWNLCNMENKMISVERILQYTAIPSEAPLVIKENHPQLSWPSQGEIDIQDLQVRYAPHLPLVLRGISCTLSGGTKTGIVGRTGSGKSTLIQTLFRIVEPTSGRITIDGIDITSIGVHDLRSKLSIIPQDPTMFEGTVRSNLDPLEEYSDDQIWEALDNCQLGGDVRKKEGKLDSTVTENGENWSMGQRQLVCLGRILLKKTKILVLDEATASVDTATDNLIQQTIRHHFADCTLVTVAHRITSILDSDRVLLLDHGLVSEYDSPKRLLEDKKSCFAELVAEYTNRSCV